MKAILIDDEPLALDFLEKQLEKLGGFEVVKKYTFFDMTLHESFLKSIDLVFLDIEMPEINGIELAEKIMEANPDISIVFVTAYNEYAVKAFELNVLDYVLKPVQIDRLKNTLQRIEKYVNLNKAKETKVDQIHIHVGKELAFETDGKLHNINWRTTKTKELFLYLLHHRGTTIRKDFLAEFFWSDLELERAYSQMYTAIYHIRKSLRDFKEYITIKSRQEGYILILENVEIDLYVWEEQLKAISVVGAETIDALEVVMERYSGPYLGTANYLWAQAEQFRLEELWLNYAYKIAAYYVEVGNFEQATNWYNEICSMREEEETAHFELMKLYSKQDNRVMVSNQYERLIGICKELSIPVGERVREWYGEWMVGSGVLR